MTFDGSNLLTRKVYVQCDVERDGPYSSIIKETAWIPKELAKMGAPLKIRDRKGDWVDGWRVTYVGTAAPIPDVQKSIRAHRKNTGDATPKTARTFD